MKRYYILLFIMITNLYSLPIGDTTSKSYSKIRAKQMSQKSTSDRYSYNIIKNRKDAKKFEDECHRIGLTTTGNQRGTKMNYVVIKNVKLNCDSYNTNIGIKQNGYSSGKIINTVEVKNAKINGKNINLGVEIKNSKNRNINSAIGNNVKVKKTIIREKKLLRKSRDYMKELD